MNFNAFVGQNGLFRILDDDDDNSTYTSSLCASPHVVSTYRFS